MKLLLVNPKFPESFWSFRWAVENVFAGKATLTSPLGLATLAALSPADWEIEIVDENIEAIPEVSDADIVGICGMGVQFRRQAELLELFRGRGHFVVAGGSFASLCPERYEGIADCVVAGEAEYVWKQFCRDFTAGETKPLYRETGEVALTESPVPRFDLLKLDRYEAVSMQFSRGCPFRCEFCDIIVMFGRKPRTKSLDQVARELDCLRRLGVRNLFFVDDNLIGDKRVAKQLLRFLRAYQLEHDYWFDLGTEVSLNVAGDEELLSLVRAANFEWVFIGIESPDPESLKETLKFQNTREDMLVSVRRIYSYGIDVLAGFIIGFDHDTKAIFDKQFEFVMASGIQAAMIGLLVAIPKTPLHKRLSESGRLSDLDVTDNTKLGTNVIPNHMDYEEMVGGYRALYHRLVADRAIADRINKKVRYFVGGLENGTDSLADELGILARLLVFGVLRGGPIRLFHFARSIPFSRPSLIPVVIRDWVVGLTIRDYVDRELGVSPAA
jgi:radical SAM superfamily enzyme YgiQ (UPF0313 family)